MITWSNTEPFFLATFFSSADMIFLPILLDQWDPDTLVWQVSGSNIDSTESDMHVYVTMPDGESQDLILKLVLSHFSEISVFLTVLLPSQIQLHISAILER